MSVPAGWYDDGSGQQRWWDGAQWTEHLAPAADAAAVATPVADATAIQDDASSFPPVADAAPAAPAAPEYAAPTAPVYGDLTAPVDGDPTAPVYGDPNATAGYPDPSAPTYPGTYPNAAQPYGAAQYPVGGAPAPKKTPVLGFIGLGVGVLGFILACIPVPAVISIGLFLLFAAFVVSLIAVFQKNTTKWPSIVGIVLSIVGGIVGAIVLVVTFVTLANNVIDDFPTTFPTSQTDDPFADESVEPSDPEDDFDAAGRPSPEEITLGFLIVMHSVDVNDYDDPIISACIGQFFYDSDLSDENLTTIAGGEDVYGADGQKVMGVTQDAITSCVLQ